MEYSDHLAQIVYIKVDKPVLGPTAIKKRQFTDNAIEEFIYLLQAESWDEVLLSEDVTFPLMPSCLHLCTISTKCFLLKHLS